MGKRCAHRASKTVALKTKKHADWRMLFDTVPVRAA
jgi:hypothetical protein